VQGEGIPQHFIDSIYDAYPRRSGPVVAKRAIWEAIQRLIARGTPNAAEWLLDRTKKFAGSPGAKRGRFTKLAVNWFNDGHYDDDEAEWFRTESEGEQIDAETEATLKKVREKLREPRTSE